MAELWLLLLGPCVFWGCGLHWPQKYRTASRIVGLYVIKLCREWRSFGILRYQARAGWCRLCMS